MFVTRGARETENPSLFSSLEEESLGALLAARSFAEALNHSARPGESLRKLCPKRLGHLRGSPKNKSVLEFDNTWLGPVTSGYPGFHSPHLRYIGSRSSLCPKRLCTAANAASFGLFS
jgi:hypothetical protein